MTTNESLVFATNQPIKQIVKDFIAGGCKGNLCIECGFYTREVLEELKEMLAEWTFFDQYLSVGYFSRLRPHVTAIDVRPILIEGVLHNQSGVVAFEKFLEDFDGVIFITKVIPNQIRPYFTLKSN